MMGFFFTQPVGDPNFKRVLRSALPAVFGIAALTFVLVGTSVHGPGVTPDSVVYLSTAQNLAHGVGFVNYSMEPCVLWPPAYPALLALIHWGGVSLLDAARYANAIAFGLVTFLVGLWVMRRTGSALAASVAFGFMLFDHNLLYVSIYAWSEAVFIGLVMVLLLLADKLLYGASLKWTAVTGCVVALICLTKYVGLAMIGFGVCLLCLNRYVGFYRRFLLLVVFGAVASLPVTLWLVRNVLVSGTMAGERGAPLIGVWESLSSMGEGFVFLFVPSPPSSRLRYMLRYIVPNRLVAVVLPIAVAYLLWKAVVQHLRRQQTPLTSAIAPALAITCYMGMLVLSISTTGMIVEKRYLILVSPPLVMCGSMVIWKIIRGNQADNRGQGKPSWKVLLLVIVCLGGLLCIRSGASIYLLRESMSEGMWYSSNRWIRSPAIQFLKDWRPDCPLMSNNPEVIWFHTGITTHFSPRKYLGRSDHYVGSRYLKTLSNKLAISGSYYLMWFSSPSFRPFLFNVPELKQYFTIVEEREFSDGVLYRVRLPKSPSREADTTMPAAPVDRHVYSSTTSVPTSEVSSLR